MEEKTKNIENINFSSLEPGLVLEKEKRVAICMECKYFKKGEMLLKPAIPDVSDVIHHFDGEYVFRKSSLCLCNEAPIIDYVYGRRFPHTINKTGRCKWFVEREGQTK